MNRRLHSNKQKSLLKERLRGALRVTVDTEKIKELVELMKAKGVISSRRDLGRKIGLASTTLDEICNRPGEVDSKISTVQAITEYALENLPELYGADEGELVDDLLGEDSPLRQDLKQAIRG